MEEKVTGEPFTSTYTLAIPKEVVAIIITREGERFYIKSEELFKKILNVWIAERYGIGKRGESDG